MLELLDLHARFVKYYVRNVALQQSLGARQWVCLQATDTVTSASYTGKTICNAKIQRRAIPLRGLTPTIPLPKQARPEHPRAL
jgi:hypothetical protein